MEPLYDVIIVGAGPAGTAAALQLARREPSVAARTLLLDAAVFPREKLCGGGVIRQSDRLLEHLGGVDRVPDVAVHEMRFLYPGGRGSIRRRSLFRVVRREEFDHALLRAARARGVRVREGEGVARLSRERNAVRVATHRDEYRARVLIGADGAHGVVRRSLVGPACGARFVALEVLTPEPAAGHAPHTAVFDFRPVERGLRGYAWDFPSVRAGERIVNRGLGGSHWPSGSSLRSLFGQALRARGIRLGDHRLEGWSAPLYHPDSPQSAERVLLAGDAVGVDPWLGEGISVALGTGIVAAHAALDALDRGRFDFADHTERLRESAVGWQLCRNRARADHFYEAAAKPGGLDAWVGHGVAR